MPDHDYGKITLKNSGDYFMESGYWLRADKNSHWVKTIQCLQCEEDNKDGKHLPSCPVPLVLELKDKVERKDRALENVLTLLELEYDTVGHRAIKLVATEALKP